MAESVISNFGGNGTCPEYCAPVWLNSSHTNKIDTQLNATMRTISGAIKSTPVPWLSVLSNISPPHLRRYSSLVQEYKNHDSNKSLPLHRYINNNPKQRLKSRKPPWKMAQQLSKENYNLNSKWTDEWRLDNPDKFSIIEKPTERPPGFQLPRKEWVTLNRLRTGHGKREICCINGDLRIHHNATADTTIRQPITS